MSDNFKAPSQVFRWFEKMKANYEHSVNSVLSKFEAYNEKQQARIDENHHDHIESIKHLHKEQQKQSQVTIEQLQSDVAYFKQQVSQQQQTIEQLNARYDAVMTTFLEQKKRDIDIKAIFDSDEEDTPIEIAKPLVSPQSDRSDETIQQTLPESEVAPEFGAVSQNQPIELPDDPSDLLDEPNTLNEVNNLNEPNVLIDEPSNLSDEFLDTMELTEPVVSTEFSESVEPDEELADKLYSEAMVNRENQDFEQAIALFKEAAKFGCVKSRGAIGRAYFLAEGVEEDQTLGLAWLITAAELGLPQAIKRVDYFQESDPELYIEASTMACHL